ncbi:ankyrin repeat domain-containing protein [Parashewanella curva]|uniref:Ankyrin repeat domain-containing protein n=1 Tax=Parashewanella curva TaxID=2338552 RepID=A0A3L8PSM5_9GAMM|nr:ankyrin repeat domain-containing protein [Parashewanella curva]RLV58420.1 ankyrin repeat domain-containing protein [Parashewanella curva]
MIQVELTEVDAVKDLTKYTSEVTKEEFMIADGESSQTAYDPEMALVLNTSSLISVTLSHTKSNISLEPQAMTALTKMRNKTAENPQMIDVRLAYYSKVHFLLSNLLKKPIDNILLSNCLKMWLSPINLATDSDYPSIDDAVLYAYSQSRQQTEALNQIKGNLIDEAIQALIETQYPKLTEKEKRHLRVAGYKACGVECSESKPMIISRSDDSIAAEKVCYQWAKTWCSPYQQLQRLNMMKVPKPQGEGALSSIDMVVNAPMFNEFQHVQVVVTQREQSQGLLIAELVEVLGCYFIKENDQLRPMAVEDLKNFDFSTLSPQGRRADIAVQLVNSFTELAQFECFFEHHASLIELEGLAGAYLTSAVRARLQTLAKQGLIKFDVFYGVPASPHQPVLEVLPRLELVRIVGIIKCNECQKAINSDKVDWPTLLNRSPTYLKYITGSTELTKRKKQLFGVFERIYNQNESSSLQMHELQRVDGGLSKELMEMFAEFYAACLEQELASMSTPEMIKDCFKRRVIPMQGNTELMNQMLSQFLDKLKTSNVSDLNQLQALLRWVDIECADSIKSEITKVAQSQVLAFIDNAHIQDTPQLFELLSLLVEHQDKLPDLLAVKQKIKTVTDKLVAEDQGMINALGERLKAEQNIQLLNYFSLGFEQPSLTVARLERLAQLKATPATDISYQNIEVLTLLSPAFFATCSQEVKDAALIFATKEINKELIKTLVEAGADVQVLDKDKNTLLHIVLSNEHASGRPISARFDAFIYLLELHKIDGSSLNNSGQSLLFLALRIHGMDFTEKVLPISKAVLNTKTNQGHSPLSVAIINRSKDKVQLLIDAGANVKDVYRCQSSVCVSALHLTVLAEKKDMVELFLNEEYQLLDYPSSDGTTPLLLAAEHSNLDCFKVIERAGANKSLRNNAGFNLLLQAAQNSEVKVFQYVWEIEKIHWKEVNQKKRNVLAVAIAAKQLHTVKLLVNSGLFDPRQLIDGELPVLFFAAKYSDHTTLEFLCQRFSTTLGINTPITLNDSQLQCTVLDLACETNKGFLKSLGAKTQAEIDAEQRQAEAEQQRVKDKLKLLESDKTRLAKENEQLKKTFARLSAHV